MYPALTWLSDLQERTLVETGVWFEHRGGFALGMIKGTERLCLLCCAFRIPTAVVSAWIQCRHCDESLTRLTSSEQEPLNYNMDLWLGLCRRPERAFKHLLKVG